MSHKNAQLGTVPTSTHIHVQCDSKTYFALLRGFVETWHEAADMCDNDPDYPIWYAESLQGVYDEYISPGNHTRQVDAYYSSLSPQVG